MHQLHKTFSALAEEIKSYHSLFLKETEKNPKIKELYKGCQILFSPLIEISKALNPAKYYHKLDGKTVEEFEHMLNIL